MHAEMRMKTEGQTHPTDSGRLADRVVDRLKVFLMLDTCRMNGALTHGNPRDTLRETRNDLNDGVQEFTLSTTRYI